MGSNGKYVRMYKVNQSTYVCTHLNYRIVGNLGEVFNFANWRFYKKMSNLTSAIFILMKSDDMYTYVLGFVMSPNLKLANSFWGLICEI